MPIETATISGQLFRPDLGGGKPTVTIEAATDGSRLTYAGMLIVGKIGVTVAGDGTATVTIPKTGQAGLEPDGAQWKLVMRVSGQPDYVNAFELTADTTWDSLFETFVVPVPSILAQVLAAADDATASATAAAASAASAAAITGLTGEDSAVALLVGSDSATRTAGDGRYAQRALQSLAPPRADPLAAKVTNLGANPRFCDYFDGYMWGSDPTNGTIWRSADKGATWTAYCNSIEATSGNKFLLRLIPVSGGEVVALYADGVYKSAGWANGNAATWTKKVSSATIHCSFLAGGISASRDGTKLIVSEYADPQANWADSRYAYISLDSGATWTAAYDSNVVIGAPNAANSHLHSCVVDDYASPTRFYVSEGHNAGGGLWVSEDNGTTWNRAAGMGQNLPNLTNGPTVVVAHPDGLVCGSDNYQNGLFGVVRRTATADEVLVPTWALTSGRDGLVAFAQQGWYDEESRLVYVSFRSEFTDTPLCIAAGTPSTGGKVYEHTSLPAVAGADRFVAVARIDDTLVSYFQYNSTPNLLTATIGVPGSPSSEDKGRVQGGASATGDSLAVGRSTATGIRAVASGQKAAAVAQDAIALGYGSAASASGAMAFGSGAAAAQGNAMAFGPNVATDAANQAKLGPRFIQVTKVTLPAIPVDGDVQLIVVDDGTGTQEQLIVQFHSGARQILATERGLRTVAVDTAHAFTDNIVVFNSAVSRTFTLLSASGRNGLKVTVKNIGTATLNIASTSGTIDGAATATLAQWAHATYISDGTNWLVL